MHGHYSEHMPRATASKKVVAAIRISDHLEEDNLKDQERESCVLGAVGGRPTNRGPRRDGGCGCISHKEIDAHDPFGTWSPARWSRA